MSQQSSHTSAGTTEQSAVRVADMAPSDRDLVRRLRRGDDGAFAQIVGGWSPMMRRVARSHVSTDASAEEIVQDTWLAVIRGLAGFEGRSSLRTWVFRILCNRAKTCGVREARSVPWSALGPSEVDSPTVDPDRFRAPDDQYPHNWTVVGAPRPWEPSPEGAALSREILHYLGEALTLLPERQRTVVTLRDVEGMSPEEVCEVLEITAANQRVLLHRARARLRAALEGYYRPTEDMMAP
jgi:RNA polymerase sigma-70 factor (ECF subfamily)